MDITEFILKLAGLKSKLNFSSHILLSWAHFLLFLVNDFALEDHDLPGPHAHWASKI